MSSVDNRIVNMRFDNAQFEKGVSTTISSLDKLKQSLNFKGAEKSIQDVQASSDKFNMQGMEGAVTGVSKSFVALSTIAITAISNITNKAIAAGTAMAKSLTIDPVAAGFKEYEQKMGAIQTIMAGSGESLEVVNQKLKELNEYSDKTIYSFSDMTQNIGKFTNAGISLEDSVASIKGVANVAALSGANAEEASRAMYNFAQALSSGSVKLQDWKSIELANMGTKEFKQQLIDSAVASGTLRKTADGMYETMTGGAKKVVSSTKGFNESLTEGWLTTEALTETLGRYSDETTDIGKRAAAAAQDVKTFTQMVDTLKESAGSGWAETWELVFGDFEEAKKLWTGINNVVGGFITRSAAARNKMLADWKEAGGRTALFEGLKNIFEALGRVMKPIQEAFREIFPRMTGQRLAELTKQFQAFTEKLKVSDETVGNIKRTFKGIFGVFSILKTIVGGVIKGIIGIFGALSGVGSDAGGGILSIAAGLGDFIVKLDEMLKKADPIGKAFEGIAKAVKAVVEPIRNFIKGLGGGIPGDVAGNVDAIGKSFAHFGEILQKVFGVFAGVDFGEVLLTGGLLGVLSVLAKGFWDFFKSINGSITGFAELLSGFSGIFSGITDVLGGVTGQLKAMQIGVKAEALMKIAAALLLLVIALWILSTLETEEIYAGLTALSALLVLLIGAMKTLDKVMSGFGVAKFTVIAVGLTILALALIALGAAVAIFGSMKTETLVRGLTGIAATLALVIAATAILGKTGGGGQLILTAVGLTILAGALTAMAKALEKYEKIDVKALASSLGKVAGVLIVIGIAMRTMPKGMIFTGAGLVLVAFAISLLADSLEKIGNIPLKKLAKGIGAIAASLIIIAVGLILMSGTISGSAALMVAAIALNMLVPVLQKLGGMKWSEIGKGLLTLAAIFAVLGLAGLILTPVIPMILLLATAVALLGAGMMLAGAGMLLFGAGLTLVAASGGVAAGVLIAVVKGLIALIPYMLEQFAKGLAASAKIIGESAPIFIGALGKLFSALLKEIVKRAPEFYQAMFDLIIGMIEAITDNLKEITEAALDLVEEFVDTMGSEESINRLTDAAVTFIENFLNALADTIRDHDQEMINAGKNIGGAIVGGIGQGLMNLGPLGGAVGWLVRAIKGRAENELDAHSPSRVFMEVGRTIPEGMAVGINKYTKVAVAATEKMADSTVTEMQETIARISEAVDTNMDMDPVIAPVLDLTDFRNKAQGLADILQTKPLTAAVTYEKAADIASTKQPIEEAVVAEEKPSVKFEQNNYSPKALSPSEIYRNTRNQLAFAKELMVG